MKPLIMLICLGSVAMACKKQNNNNEPASYPEFYPLKTGNYWVYQQFRVDTVGNAIPLDQYDSCYVEGDTLINGNTYSILRKSNPLYTMPPSIIRDSLNYIVGADGSILFSSKDFNNIFSTKYSITNYGDTIAKLTTRMTDKDLIINVPAGSFKTCNFQLTVDCYPNWRMTGRFKYDNTRYAENIGIILLTPGYRVDEWDYIEERLVRYHLN